MNLRIIIKDEAINDAIAIAEYLARKSSMTASDNFLNATTQAYRRLAEMPGIGAPRDYGPDVPGLRMWRVPRFANYLIFYQATVTELTVLRVMHGSQNIEEAFSPPDPD